MAKYIYHYPEWPYFSWDDRAIATVFGEVRHLQGKLLGQMNALGFAMQTEAALATLTLDVLKSSEIEGERLNYEQVRSSIARRLGMDVAGLVPSSRHIDGVVEMMLDATQNYREPLTDERLFGWHAALFPTGRSGMYKIDVGRYRTGEMQVVSGAMGKEKIHYEAPPPAIIQKEMTRFLYWLNDAKAVFSPQQKSADPVLKAAVAHLWFVTIHPFNDGNGRIARAISDMLLARSDENPQRFYSLSNQILAERKKYYEVLQKTQQGNGNITEWMDWFLHCLKRALLATEDSLQHVLRKADFWKTHSHTSMNERQRLMLNKLLDGFEGKLQSSKWAKITHCSQDTALRDIKDLMEKGILKQDLQSGRSTSYILN
ncbi:MAG: Fic family protein [Prevotellaceae bacterium]|jgi:Fic family protein|nr:Fic family protein [Prevotellaceae bacterium]